METKVKSLSSELEKTKEKKAGCQDCSKKTFIEKLQSSNDPEIIRVLSTENKELRQEVARLKAALQTATEIENSSTVNVGEVATPSSVGLQKESTGVPISNGRVKRAGGAEFSIENVKDSNRDSKRLKREEVEEPKTSNRISDIICDTPQKTMDIAHLTNSAKRKSCLWHDPGLPVESSVNNSTEDENTVDLTTSTNDVRSCRLAKLKSPGTQWASWQSVLSPIITLDKGKERQYKHFVKTFRKEYDIEDYYENETLQPDYLPKEYHELFRKEFQEMLGSDGDTGSEASRSSTSPTEVRKNPFSEIGGTPWKEVITKAIPNQSIDYQLQKKIWSNIKDFLIQECEKIGFDHKLYFPVGNRSKQYLVPQVLHEKFISWFKVLLESNEVVVKKPTQNSNQTSKPIQIDSKYEQKYTQLPTPKWSMKPYKEYFPLLPPTAEEKVYNKVRTWLIIKLRKMFCYCIMDVNRTLGVPDTLTNEFEDFVKKEFKDL